MEKIGEYICERYCDYDLSIMLKTIGFNGECTAYYIEGDKTETLYKVCELVEDDYVIPAPTLQTAHAWLLNMVFCSIEPKRIYTSYDDESDTPDITYLLQLNNDIVSEDGAPIIFENYYDAIEYGIYEIVNHTINETMNSLLNDIGFDEDNVELNEYNSTTTCEPEVIENEEGKKILKLKLNN